MATFRAAQSSLNDDFLTGTVFGFDIGTGSIGYAVRKGKEFLDVGVLICPEDTADLKGRRGLRRQRRTLRSKKYRRQWLAKELEKLGLPKPKTNCNDPIALRCRAVKGAALYSRRTSRRYRPPLETARLSGARAVGFHRRAGDRQQEGRGREQRENARPHQADARRRV
jgi:hypothetical protein